MEQQVVLAIEPDWRLYKLIRANLETLDMKIQGAVNMEHGLQLLRERLPDLILLDLDLPYSEAWLPLETFVMQLAGHPIPIVILSTEPPSRKLCEHKQIIGYLKKPFAAPALLEQVRRALVENDPQGHQP